MSVPHYGDESVTLWHGDCLDVIRTLADASVDSVCTDPPYGLEFMGKAWDAPWKDEARAASATVVEADAIGGYQDGNGGNAYSRSRVRTDTRRHGGDMQTANVGFQSWCEQWATECLRVLKPGGHLLAFGGTRTWHRLACAVEDAGFEVRDSIAWLYGSGFPKSLDVSKAIDRAAGAERDVVGSMRRDQPGGQLGYRANAIYTYEGGDSSERPVRGGPATDDARTWQGWGTALKPAFEPIVVARKPLVGTVAANVLAHGTGALNVDGCRVEASDAPDSPVVAANAGSRFVGLLNGGRESAPEPRTTSATSAGRWPANVVLDESQAVELDRQSGVSRDGVAVNRNRDETRPMTVAGTPARVLPEDVGYGGQGGASRFFYVAKAPTTERPREDGIAHPTVKPLDLMRWLVRLVTPPGGTVLEPFAGSGTTAEACVIEGFRCIAIEREADYLPLIVARLSKPIQPSMFGGVA